MMPREIHNRYVLLANNIARLSAEAGDLEVAMSELDSPMTLQVYNHLRDAQGACVVALHMLDYAPIEIVDQAAGELLDSPPSSA